MTKYSPKFKAELVHLCLEEDYSVNEIKNNYGISKSLIYSWIDQVNVSGYQILARRAKQKYSQNFKLMVVKCYQNHNEGYSKVASYFKINQSQVRKWVKDFENYGITALRLKKIGRPSMKKSKGKKALKEIPKTKEEEYKQKISDLEEKLRYTQMELDISKKLRALKERK
ncbi:transposase [Fructilactobacillus vespulae]|uniref:transposase n=1 Tax=Fructilactobacillus vespulae TaxID=1249630 RepID=UPI0039B4129C